MKIGLKIYKSMAHKTFISYKYSESQQLRNKIIEALGDDATYYKGKRAILLI